jgi:hypothetical protein
LRLQPLLGGSAGSNPSGIDVYVCECCVLSGKGRTDRSNKQILPTVMSLSVILKSLDNKEVLAH